jgi:hypothetical protein
MFIGGLDAFLRCYNEASEENRVQGIRTKIGTFTSSDPIGTLPLSLIWAIKQWPDSSACLADPFQRVLRWAELGSRTAIKVCLSRVFNNVGSGKIAATLTANGFSGASVDAASLSSKGAKYTVSATCIATARPCGVVVNEFMSFPTEAYAYTVRVIPFPDGMTDVRVIPLAK